MTVMGKVWKSGNNKTSKNKKNKKLAKQDFKSTGKRGRLILRNLPFKCNEDDVENHFSSFGQIKDINLLRRPDKKLVGCGFVEFVSRRDADRAKDELNGKPFLGRPIYIDRAVSQNNYTDPPKNKEEQQEDSSGEENLGHDEDVHNTTLDESKVKQEHSSDDDLTPQIKKEKLTPEEEADVEKSHEDDVEKRREDKTNRKNKARLIVRNLSFKTTEKNFKAHFSHFGDLEEVKLLRKPDKSLVGCGFVQFSRKTSAAKAIHHTSGKPFLGRPIIVDWAVSKDKFLEMQETAEKREIKQEVKSESDDDEGDVGKPEKSEDSSEDSSDNESESDEEEEEKSEDESRDAEEDGEETKPRRQLREDVDEGKTVFVKRLPFSATDEEFKECMKQFGPVIYALICRDKLTEHSKGSGFVKFKEKKDAEKCLEAGTELTLKGNILDPHPALKRGEAQQLQEKNKEKKDNRNLYLVKEGMIIAGTAAAKGVSVTDMERRLQLEQWKTTKLRNLNMFVSRNRMVVHNIPATYSDKQLRKLFMKYAGSKAVIKEARIMRDFKKVDASGKGVSKGFGFVSFEKHEDALSALRGINNNPSIFTPTARPIVSFSIENRSVLNTKEKRMVRSRQKNPLCKDYKPEEAEVPPKRAKFTKDIKSENSEEPDYAGFTAKPGSTVKMRKNYKLKNQAQQHVQDVRKQKQEVKISRKVRRIEHVKNKQNEKKLTKKNKKNVDDDAVFSNLVNKYKKKIISQANEKKKWYDD